MWRKRSAAAQSGGDRAPAGATSSTQAGRGRPDAREVSPEPPGLGARRLATRLIEAVLVEGRALEDALEAADRDGGLARLETRDRGFARLIAATVLRRLGSLEAVLAAFLERPLPVRAHRGRAILLAGAAQVLLIGTPVHAAVSLAVEQCRRDPAAARLDKLANAVLRRVAREGAAVLAGLDAPRIDVPDWLWARWVEAYGAEGARRIAAASLAEAPLDVSVKVEAEAAAWAERLGGQLLATGSIRLEHAGRVEELAGFAEGAWWVQDVAAALPARLLGEVRGLEVGDLCAAPGGKTAALAARGARVMAIDSSPQRMARLAENMRRLGLEGSVEMVAADVASWTAPRALDAVLLDAPCTATGTIRRHPDILRLKRPGDAARLAAIQLELLKAAARSVRPGGRLIYCVCSLEPEEGQGVVEAFLAGTAVFMREPIAAGELAGHGAWITSAGDLRTLPCHSPSPASAGMDGFYAARLVRAPA